MTSIKTLRKLHFKRTNNTWYEMPLIETLSFSFSFFSPILLVCYSVKHWNKKFRKPSFSSLDEEWKLRAPSPIIVQWDHYSVCCAMTELRERRRQSSASVFEKSFSAFWEQGSSLLSTEIYGLLGVSHVSKDRLKRFINSFRDVNTIPARIPIVD